MVLELVGVLDDLHAEKDGPENHRQDQPDNRGFALIRLRGAYGQRHGQRAADQDDRVERAPEERDRGTRRDKCVVVPNAVQHVGHEQPTEKQDFGDQKGPHAKDGGFLLLRHRLEVMLQRRMVRRVGVAVSVGFNDRVRQPSSPSPVGAYIRRARSSLEA